MKARIAYGIEDDGNSFRVVVRARRRRGRTVFEPTVPEKNAAEKLPIPAQRFAPIAGSLSSGEVVLRRLTAPLSRPSKAARILPTLLEEGLPFSLEQCITRFTEVRQGGPDSVTGLGMAALRNRIEARRDAYQAAGYAVTRLEHEGLALWRRSLTELPPGTTDEPRAILYATPTRVSLAMGHGAVLESTYGATRRPGQMPEGARRALQAWRMDTGAPIRGCWAGSTAENTQDRTRLEAEFSKTGLMHYEAHAEPTAFLARALAESALDHPGDGGFLKGPLEPPALQRRAEMRVRRVALFALAAGLLACSGAWRLRSQTDRLETVAGASLNALARETIGAAVVPVGFEEDRVRAYFRDRASDAAPLQAFDAPSLLGVIADIAETARTQALSIAHVRIDRETFEMEGRADDWNRPTTLVEPLRRHGYAPEVKREEPGADEQIPFVVKGGRS